MQIHRNEKQHNRLIINLFVKLSYPILDVHIICKIFVII